jgi:ATPase subunit of ABC transporter with duplicated ATPase domains
VRAARDDSVHAARTRLARFEEAGPPRRPPKEQNVRMRLRGGRTGKRALTCTGLSVCDLTGAFDLEAWFGERVAVLGGNGTGKSRFLALLAGAPDVPHRGTVTFGARVVPGHFAQTHTRPDLRGRTPADIVMSLGIERNDAMAALARYEIAPAWRQPFETLSGGQQARLQILLLELTGATLLLLDEPTDNLDLASADALQQGLRAFTGTVLVITHDRWFATDFDRFLHFSQDGQVRETDTPTWSMVP